MAATISSWGSARGCERKRERTPKISVSVRAAFRTGARVSALVADVRPFPALHYDPANAGPIADLVAPPYDVIDDAQRAELLARSPSNVVEIDLPRTDDGSDPYEHAAGTLDQWRREGILVQDSEPSIWALTQDYSGPDGAQRTRHGILARVRVEDYGAGRVRPHERTQPGPKQDRLDLTRATRFNLSPIFSLASRDPWPLVEPALGGDPWAEVTDDDGTVHRIWRITDPDLHAAVARVLEPAELLIADGHHRYETARSYRDEIGGEGPSAISSSAGSSTRATAAWRSGSVRRASIPRVRRGRASSDT